MSSRARPSRPSSAADSCRAACPRYFWSPGSPYPPPCDQSRSRPPSVRSAREHQVGRLDIAVDDFLPVRVIHGVTQLPHPLLDVLHFEEPRRIRAGTPYPFASASDAFFNRWRLTPLTYSIEIADVRPLVSKLKVLMIFGCERSRLMITSPLSSFSASASLVISSRRNLSATLEFSSGRGPARPPPCLLYPVRSAVHSD